VEVGENLSQTKSNLDISRLGLGLYLAWTFQQTSADLSADLWRALPVCDKSTIQRSIDVFPRWPNMSPFKPWGQGQYCYTVGMIM
jgi:hypothetical protein